MKQKLLSSFFALVFLIGVSYAQNRQVSGKVTSATDGSPISGVSVSVVGSSTATQTDGSGNYSISASNGSVLNFSYIGYVSQRVTVGNQAVINIQLVSDAETLEEVVVTALGIERSKKDLGYAATTVNNAELTNVNAVNVAGGLTGKVSGLNVTGLSSGIFEEVRMNLRGIRSLTGKNNPLLVIDGVPMDLNYLSSLNPNDIENVSVLKGSSSASIYGPDARNGVIVVTTKKGSDVPTITVGHSTQFQNVSFFPALQKQFGTGFEGQYDPIENMSWGPAYDGSTVDIGPQLPDGSQQTAVYSPTDERKKFYETGVTHQTDLSVSTKDVFVSLQDAFVKGIVPNDKNRRTGVRVNVSKEINRFSVNLNTNYIQQNYNYFDVDGPDNYFTALNTGGNTGIFNQLVNTPAHIKVTQYKDFRNDKWSQHENWFTNYGLNPYFQAGNWRTDGKKQDFLSNLELNFEATDWLKFTYRAGLVSRNITDRNSSLGVSVTSFGISREKDAIPSSIEEYNYNLNNLSSELFGQVDKQISDDFRLSAILGTYVRQNDYRTTRVGAGSVVVPDIFNVENRLGNLTGSSDGFKSRLFSVFGNVALNYKGWANVELTGRTDKTSLLAKEHNTYFYPGISGSLVLSEAIPSLRSSTLSFLKVRAAWNKTGNADITPYLLAASFSQPAESGFPFGTVPGFTAGNTNYDPDLKPEFINSTEVGLETGFLNNRIQLEGTYFYQNNTDQIINVRVSDATGYRAANRNAASFINKGFELDLNITPIVKFTDGDIRFRANATYNDSEVTSVLEQADKKLEEVVVGTYYAAVGNYAIKGHPAFMFKANDYERDDQGRIIVDATTGRPSTASELSMFGRTMPKWVIGLNPSVRWKSFNLSALFEHKSGHQASFFDLGGSMAWTGTSEATAYNNREPFILPNSVIEDPGNPGHYIENTTAKIGENEHVLYHYIEEYNNTASNFLVNARSWRFRELALTYNVPQNWLSARQGVIKSLSIALVGRNLALWLPKENKYMDPDFNSFYEDNTNEMGMIDATSNPPVRNYGFTINAKF